MDFTLNVPFTKVNKEQRTVTGIATADNVDKEDDIIDFGASTEAFNQWPGNVREMHMPKAVGKMVDFRPTMVTGADGQMYSGMETTIYVSKGAEDTWKKVLDGTLKGFSVGGDIIDSTYEFSKSDNKSYRRVKKYAMHELSLVDNPANPVSTFTMIKSVGDNHELELQGDNDFSDIHTLFYCEKDGIAKVDESTCKDHEMTQIGFIEDFDSREIRKMIESYENNKNGGEKSESVLHKNANTGIVNNMEELNDTQKASILKRLGDSLFGSNDSGETSSPAFEAPAKENPLAGVFSPVFNITVPNGSEVSEAKVEEVKDEVSDEEEVVTEEAQVEEVTAETEGGDNVDTNEVVTQVTAALAEQLAEITKSFDARFETLEKSVGEQVESVKVEVDTAKGDLEKFANDGAISKSVETGSDDESETVSDEVTDEQPESFWKGAFVDAEIISALGYTS